MKRLLLAVATVSLGLAQPIEKFSPLAGITLGKIDYRLSEKQRDPKLETFLIANEEIPDGQEVWYLYNHFSLDGEQKNVLVFLTGSYFAGSGGGTGLVLLETPQAPLGFRCRGRFTLVNPPILAATPTDGGPKNLTWLRRGGGMRPYYGRVHFEESGYPDTPSHLPAGTELSGTAYLADVLTPDNCLRFKVAGGVAVPSIK